MAAVFGTPCALPPRNSSHEIKDKQNELCYFSVNYRDSDVSYWFTLFHYKENKLFC
jgi:hypothetical protein